MKKQFFAAAMILALGAGFTACSSDDLNVKDQKEVKSGKETMTYMTYTFTVPTSGTRADATDDKQGVDEPGYNYVGKYVGNDKIAGVIAYVFNGDTDGATLETTQTLGTNDFEFVQEVAVDGNNKGKTTIKPKKAIQVTVGTKTVFLVVNPNDDVKKLLKNANTLGDFKVAYNSASLAFTGRSAVKGDNTGLDVTTAKPLKTAADVIAKLATTGSEILMTGASVSKAVNAGVTEDQTKNVEVGSSAQNRFNFTLKRAVATVVVSTKAASYEIKGDDPTQEGVQNVVTATISELSFSEAQGEQKLYLLQQTAPTADNTAFQTPAYSFVPNGNAAVDAEDNYSKAKDKYEYNGLWRINTSAHNTKGIALGVKDLGTATALTAETYKEYVAANLGVPFLPATHKWTADGGNYREGNTAYLLIRGYVSPKFVYKVKGDNSGVEVDPSWNGNDVFYGADGKFYATKAAAEKAVTGQKVKIFKNRICMYTVWINPDKNDKTWKNGPTNRNNIYHISINNIKTIGESWNPLVPGDYPNPDPRPEGDTGDNPHTPGGKLSPDNTWMSVDAVILPWAVHSYGVEL